MASLFRIQPIAHFPPSPPPDPPPPPDSDQTHLTRRPHFSKHQSTSRLVNTAYFLDGPVSSTAYASSLGSCTCPILGKQIHAHLVKTGFHRREFVVTKLLQMYGRCGHVDSAIQVFDKTPVGNLYTYTAILNVLLDHECYKEAFFVIRELLLDDLELEFFLFTVALKVCGGYGGLELGRQLHAMVVKYGFLSSHVYVGNALIDMYGKCGSLDDAKKVFSTMFVRDDVSWNSIVTACASNGMMFEALGLVEEMIVDGNVSLDFVPWSALVGGFVLKGYDDEAIEMLYRMKAAGCEPNARVLATIVAACARLQRLRLGKEIYGYITRHGFLSTPYIVNGLIDLYRRCGDMESAFQVFSRFSVRDEVSFNTMIAGYFDNGEIRKAEELFDQMEYEGKQKDLVSWNSMISGYADNSLFNKALRMFIDLITEGGINPNPFTLGSTLGACAGTGSLRLGKGIHSYCIVKGLQSNLFVGGSLVEMYSRCRDLEAARRALLEVVERDITIWNSLISGYARCNQIGSIPCVLQEMERDGLEPNLYTWNGMIASCLETHHHESALQLLSDMQSFNLRPDVYTVGMALTAFSKLAMLERGKQVHSYAIRHLYESDAYVGSALVDMYAKCGNINYARLAHSRVRNYNLVTQNTLLTAYSMHGRGEDGIAFFHEMLIDGYVPDSVTFVAVLFSCVHSGLVDVGLELFSLMERSGLEPTLKHYSCIIDLLSRAGRLNQAYEILEKMPMDPDSVVWGALLGGCITYGDVELGEIAACKLIELDPDNSGNYVMLANLYASTGRWCELAEVRRQMKDEQLNKDPGCSWIEDKHGIHVFMACDRSHREAKETYDMLDNLTVNMRLEPDEHNIVLFV